MDTETENRDNEERDGNRYDTNIPTEHSYLGHMDNLHGYTIYDEGTEMEMLGLNVNTWVCPGYTLPLYIDHHREFEIFKQYIPNMKTFVLLCSQFEGYGVTMEIIESSEKDSSLALKAKGRQRCVVVEKKAQLHIRMARVIVRILLDADITSPLLATQLPCLNKCRHNVTNHETLMKNKKLRIYDGAQLQWPLWVYDQNEPYLLTKKILYLLNAYTFGQYAPSDPIKLSYWFMQNFQLNNDERLQILKLNSAVQRLKLELHYLQMIPFPSPFYRLTTSSFVVNAVFCKLYCQKRLLCCASCSTVVAKQSDIFSMSKDGVQSNYCNPGSSVHETLTVSKAYRITYIGYASEEFSWFPGYTWTIVQCAECSQHLGWLFTSKKLKPRKFFGLTKNSINVKVINPED